MIAHGSRLLCRWGQGSRPEMRPPTGTRLVPDDATVRTDAVVYPPPDTQSRTVVYPPQAFMRRLTAMPDDSRRGERHRYPNRYFRPEPALYERAKVILHARGSNVNDYLEERLRELVGESDPEGASVEARPEQGDGHE